MLPNSSLKVRWFKFSSLPIELLVSHLLESILPVLGQWLQTNTRIKFKEKSCFGLPMGRLQPMGLSQSMLGSEHAYVMFCKCFRHCWFGRFQNWGPLYILSNKIRPEARDLLTLGNSFLGLRVRLLSPDSAHITGAGLDICCLKHLLATYFGVNALNVHVESYQVLPVRGGLEDHKVITRLKFHNFNKNTPSTYP